MGARRPQKQVGALQTWHPRATPASYSRAKDAPWLGPHTCGPPAWGHARRCLEAECTPFPGRKQQLIWVCPPCRYPRGPWCQATSRSPHPVPSMEREAVSVQRRGCCHRGRCLPQSLSAAGSHAHPSGPAHLQFHLRLAVWSCAPREPLPRVPLSALQVGMQTLQWLLTAFCLPTSQGKRFAATKHVCSNIWGVTSLHQVKWLKPPPPRPGL